MIHLDRIFENFCIHTDSTIQDFLINVGQSGYRNAVVVDDNYKILGICSDGDIRKILLAGTFGLSTKITEVMNTQPIVVESGNTLSKIKRLMSVSKVDVLPLVELGVLKGLFVMRPDPLMPPLVIMAGGRGSRLMPLTEKVPKPMLEVGGVPILERLLKRARSCSVDHIFLSVNYQKKKIKDYFSEGAELGLTIEYLEEERALGTGGSLKLLDASSIENDYLFVSNADLLMDLDFLNLYEYGCYGDFDIVMVTRKHTIINQYGVVEEKDSLVTALVEKPIYESYINCGVYLLKKDLLDRLSLDESFDMTDLILAALRENARVGSYHFSGLWIDIGSKQEFNDADNMFKNSDEHHLKWQ